MRDDWGETAGRINNEAEDEYKYAERGKLCKRTHYSTKITALNIGVPRVRDNRMN